MHGVSAASSSPLLEVLYYFQQVYSGYTLGNLPKLIPNFDYDFLVGEIYDFLTLLAFSVATFVPKFQLQIEAFF